jgi:hypothetical protein
MRESPGGCLPQLEGWEWELEGAQPVGRDEA